MMAVASSGVCKAWAQTNLANSNRQLSCLWLTCAAPALRPPSGYACRSKVLCVGFRESAAGQGLRRGFKPFVVESCLDLCQRKRAASRTRRTGPGIVAVATRQSLPQARKQGQHGFGGVKRSLLHDTLSLIRVAKGNVLPPVYCPVYTPMSPCQPGGFVKGRLRDKAHGTKLLSTRLGMTSGHSSPAINR